MIIIKFSYVNHDTVKRDLKENKKQTKSLLTN